MILGADPGKTGGLALYEAATGSVAAYRIPLTLQPRRDKTAIHRIDVINLLRLLSNIANLEPSAVVIEDVTGWSSDGGSRAFQFGRSVGQLETAMAAAGLPGPIRVSAAVWKAALGVTADKATSIARASELMPGGAASWAKADGLAEAALIAYYGAHALGLDGCEPKQRKRARHRITASSLARVLQPVE